MASLDFWIKVYYKNIFVVCGYLHVFVDFKY